jgi:SAM-dependent methyltransferase
VTDAFGGRPPTSHERMAGVPWDASYHDGPAPWDIGGPQPAVARLAAAGAFVGPVLDAGCGTGDNALCIAERGVPVLGFDVAETALGLARDKARALDRPAEFVLADALRLETLGRRFRTVLDCGLFHTFDEHERPDYVASLRSVTEPDSTLYVLCFSDDGPDPGPHPLSRDDLVTAFVPARGWRLRTIEADRVRTRFHHEHGAPAWLATVDRCPVG